VRVIKAKPRWVVASELGSERVSNKAGLNESNRSRSEAIAALHELRVCPHRLNPI
jgi:hypothetical protein